MLNTSAIGMITLSLPLFNPSVLMHIHTDCFTVPFSKKMTFDSICDGVLAFEQLWIKSRTN